MLPGSLLLVGRPCADDGIRLLCGLESILCSRTHLVVGVRVSLPGDLGPANGQRSVSKLLLEAQSDLMRSFESLRRSEVDDLPTLREVRASPDGSVSGVLGFYLGS